MLSDDRIDDLNAQALESLDRLCENGPEGPDEWQPPDEDYIEAVDDV